MNIATRHVPNRSAPAADWRVEHFGSEDEPVIVIDNFSGCIGEIEAFGRRARYAPVAGYPGIRSPFDARYLGIRGALMGDLIAECFGLQKRCSVESCSLSIVTLPPDQLHQQQRRPHYDGTAPNLLATVHYTGGSEQGGTAFYRHRRTGFEAITPERAAQYEAAVREDDREFGPLPPAYYHGDSERYEMTGEIAAAADRLIVYRGWRLHSGHIPVAPDRGAMPAEGRLTVNSFLIAEI
ncbi:DUF6445 family protein [Altererythrobacter sp. CAU 1778]